MTLAFGIISAVLALIVTVYLAKQDKLPGRYLAMLVGSAIAAIAGTVWSEAEQRTFEDYLLGGESYVYVTFEALDESSSKFVLRHSGERNPVYDLFVDIFDIRKFEGINTRDPREFAKRMQSVQRSAFGPEMATSVLNNFHPVYCYGYWAALTQQRNGPVVSVIQARIIAGKWESATRVYSMESQQKLVKEYTTDGWRNPSEWPVVTFKAAGSFYSKTPTLKCSPS
jgi:hypothetical protein